MTVNDKIEAIAKSIRAYQSSPARNSFEVCIGRSGVTKASATRIVANETHRAKLLALLSDVIVDLTYYPTRGYQASSNGAFGHYRQNDRRAKYVTASAGIVWK